MNILLETYRRSREALLKQITSELSKDDRFLAAWLTGSYARGNADDVSDLDISLVVAEPHESALCARHDQVSARTTPERLELFSRFGRAALIHENNNNAPPNGTFTFVLYAQNAVMVDWILMPRRSAERPVRTILLFDKHGIPIAPVPEPEQLDVSRKAVQEMWAFFWMMSAVSTKYLIRGNLVFVQNQLEQLQGLLREIERRMERRSPQDAYVRGSLSTIQPTRERQGDALRQLIETARNLQPSISGFIGSEPATPVAEIESLLAMADG